MNCLHRSPRYYRRLYGDGLFHIVEKCPECGKQTNPNWIPHARFPDPEALPVDPWAQPPRDPRQTGFGW